MTVIEQFISHVKSSSQVNIDRAIKTLLTSDIDRNWTDTGDLCGTGTDVAPISGAIVLTELA